MSEGPGAALVTEEAHEALLAELVRSAPGDPAAGLFGPGSPMWRVAREGIAFVGGGRAALLQLAHPVIAQGVAHHSRTRADLAGRFQRTFEHVFELVFGEREAALASARRVFRIHERVRGRHDEAAGPFARGAPYAALDEGALLWVHATLVETAVGLYERHAGPLDPASREAYYQDTRRFARLFGVSDRVLPRDWPAFRAYFDGMVSSEVLTVGERARELCGFLLTAPRPALKPLWRWYAVVTAGLLPAGLRDAYGLRWGLRQRALHRGTMAALELSYRRLPERLRHLPAYVDAHRRLSGNKDRDLFGRLAKRLVLGSLRPTTL